MPSMTERYGTGTPFSFRGFGTPAKKKKPIPQAEQYGGFSLSSGPVDEEAKKKRKLLGSMKRGW